MSADIGAFVAKVASLGLMMLAPLGNTALVGTTQGAADCQLWLSQSSIATNGSAQLVWSTANATGATMSENGNTPVSIAASGSVAVSPNTARTYTLVARNVNNGSSKTCIATLSVSSGSTSAPTCAISTTPGTHYAGQAVQLVWYTQGAQAATISNIGSVPSSQLAQGTITVHPSQSTLYTMTVGNAAATRTCSAAVTITSQTSTIPQTTTSYVMRPVQTATTYSTPSSAYTAPRYVSSPSYSTSVPSYSTRSYAPSSSGYTTRESWDMWDSPSRSNGLGDYTLTNIWNDIGDGGSLSFTNHDCYGNDCSPYATSWGAGNPDGSYTYGIGDGMGYGVSATRDANDNLIGYGSVPSEAESNAALNNPNYRWSSPSAESESLGDNTSQSPEREFYYGSGSVDSLYNGGYGNLYDENANTVPMENYVYAPGDFNNAAPAFNAFDANSANYYGMTVEMNPSYQETSSYNPWSDSENYAGNTETGSGELEI